MVVGVPCFDDLEVCVILDSFRECPPHLLKHLFLFVEASFGNLYSCTVILLVGLYLGYQPLQLLDSFLRVSQLLRYHLWTYILRVLDLFKVLADDLESQ